MAVTTVIGYRNDIHPRNKQDVGKRVAAIALHNIYKQINIAGGLVFDQVKLKANNVTVFKQSRCSLLSPDANGNLNGFEIAGSNRKFKPAIARIDENVVVVYHKDILQPVAVRYCWMDDACLDLFI